MTGTGEVLKRRVREGTGEFPIDCPMHDTSVRVRYRVRAVRGGVPGEWVWDGKGQAAEGVSEKVEGQQQNAKEQTGGDSGEGEKTEGQQQQEGEGQKETEKTEGEGQSSQEEKKGSEGLQGEGEVHQVSGLIEFDTGEEKAHVFFGAQSLIPSSGLQNSWLITCVWNMRKNATALTTSSSVHTQAVEKPH